MTPRLYNVLIYTENIIWLKIKTGQQSLLIIGVKASFILGLRCLMIYKLSKFRSKEHSDEALNNDLSLSNWRYPQNNKYEKQKLK